jgi:hypothetical protein
VRRVIIIFIFFLLTSAIYGQTVLIRPGASIGYCSADDMEGMSYTYGLKVLLMANGFQRYGIKIDHLNILSDEKRSYLSTGLFIEQVVFKYFNMGIGTVGYINTVQWGENPFGLYTHLGFEYNFKKRFGILAAYQSEFIFRKSFTMNNAFLLEIVFKF